MEGVVMSDKLLWKVKEVAALLRVNSKTVYSWVAKGVIESSRLPRGGIRIPDHEVARLYGQATAGLKDLDDNP